MKNIILTTIALLFIFSGTLQAQTRNLKMVIELQMPKTKADDYCGTRGASVCWNPVTQKYYAAFCGNSKYPMAVFTSTGKRISNEDLTTMEDIRGIWYDPAAKKIMTNGYNDKGWLYYTIDDDGIPTEINSQFSEMNQPNAQSVGSYDAVLKNVFFLDKSRVVLYENFSDLFARADDSVQIHWGRTKLQGPGKDEKELAVNNDYNYTNVVATGIKDAEFGLLNISYRQIELYGRKEGYLKQTLNLPASATVESSFNFAFSNGIYWLFDIENRKWIGYK